MRIYRGGGINTRSFIQINDSLSLSQALEEIKRLDNDENAYLEILSEPFFIDSLHKEKFDKNLEEFLYAIFSKSFDKAHRRSRTSLAKVESRRYGYYSRLMHALKRYAPTFFLRLLRKL